MTLRRGALVMLGGLFVAGCARYQPQPIDAAAHVAEYRARRLDDSALVEWVGKWAGPLSADGWTDRQLAVAALRLRTELPRARAEWRTAKAGEGSAGARPRSGVNADVERSVSGSQGQPPWVVAIGGLLSVELGGKRAARIQGARAHTAAAEAELAGRAREIVLETRRAALGVTLVEAERHFAALELAADSKVQTLEQQRFAEAAVTAAELSRTNAEVEEVRVVAAAAERDWIEARASLAAAVGVQSRALDSVVVLPVASTACERLDAIGLRSLESLALTMRPEIARSLAEYAGAEAALRLQVARQFPDLDLGPGFIWDQGVHRWTLALALPGLLAFRNRAPIAEAEAARTAAGAKVLEVQDSVLREVGLAGEGCRGAGVLSAAADSQVAASGRNLARAKAAFERGETARLDAALAELAVVRAERVRHAAERELKLAGIAVEGATGEWGGREAVGWPDPRAENGEEGEPR